MFILSLPPKDKKKSKRKSHEKERSPRRKQSSPDPRKKRKTSSKPFAPKEKVGPSPEVLNLLKETRLVYEALIRKVVAENPELGEAAERLQEKKISSKKDLFKLIPRSRVKLKSVA